MDINLNPDGVSFGFGYELIIFLLILAIPIAFIWWRILRKRLSPEKPRKIYLIIATILTTIIIYIIMVLLCFLYIKLSLTPDR